MRKKLFAVIMSAMMMITFMPTMAFAATTPAVNWDDNYKTGTYQVGTETKKCDGKKSFVTGGSPAAWTGEIEVTPVDKFGVAVADVAGTDTYVDKSTVVLDGLYNVTSLTHAEYVALEATKADSSYRFYAKKGLIFEESPATWGTPITGAKISFEDNYDEEKMYEDQTVTFTLSLAGTWPTNVKSTLPQYTVTVKAADPTAAGAEFGLEDDATVSLKKSDVNPVAPVNKNTIPYNGTERKLVQKELAGVSTTYEVFNEDKNEFEATANATFKNVGTYLFRTTSVIKADKAVRYIEVNVAPADVAFEFDTNARTSFAVSNPSGGVSYIGRYFVVKKNFKPYDYVSVNAQSTVPAAKSAAKKAIEADKALFDEFFNDFYEITLTPEKYDTNILHAAIATKSLNATNAEKDAFVEKYKTFMKNYGMNTGSVAIKRGNVVTLAQSFIDTTVDGANCEFCIDQETIINWKKAPLTKTYTAKALKKGSKKFTIKATSASSEKVTYRLTKGGSMIKINKTTGKVTVKKGLKKGTYKVNVYAYAGYDKDHNSGSDSYTLKIKVK